MKRKIHKIRKDVLTKYYIMERRKIEDIAKLFNIGKTSVRRLITKFKLNRPRSYRIPLYKMKAYKNGNDIFVEIKELVLILDYKDYNRICDMPVFLQGSCKYPTTLLNNKKIILSRFIMNYNGNLFIDHIDGNIMNNRRSNLRIATYMENNANAKKRKNTTSKYKGVSQYIKGQWQAYIHKNKKRYTLGFFNTEKEAAQAYNTKAVELFGEFARLNEL